jgi:hypothetical protein
VCGTTKTLKNKKKTMDILTKFYKTMAIRNGLHGCETWVMTSRGKSRLQAAGFRFLRSVIKTRRKDQIGNYIIRNKRHAEGLNDTIYKCREKWEIRVNAFQTNSGLSASGNEAR